MENAALLSGNTPLMATMGMAGLTAGKLELVTVFNDPNKIKWSGLIYS
jgi:hypothetical protein